MYIEIPTHATLYHSNFTPWYGTLIYICIHTYSLLLPIYINVLPFTPYACIHIIEAGACVSRRTIGNIFLANGVSERRRVDLLKTQTCSNSSCIDQQDHRHFWVMASANKTNEEIHECALDTEIVLFVPREVADFGFRDCLVQT